MLAPLVVCFLGLSFSVAGQEEPEIPTWWVTQPEAGQIPSNTWCGYTYNCYKAGAECPNPDYRNLQTYKSPTSVIWFPESLGEDLCINFPLPSGESIRHGKSKARRCINGCCQWIPPSNQIEAPTDDDYTAWYEPSSASCSEDGSAQTGPILFQDKQENADIAVCIDTKKDGKFELKEGKLGPCFYGCCAFSGEEPPSE